MAFFTLNIYVLDLNETITGCKCIDTDAHADTVESALVSTRPKYTRIQIKEAPRLWEQRWPHKFIALGKPAGSVRDLLHWKPNFCSLCEIRVRVSIIMQNMRVSHTWPLKRQKHTALSGWPTLSRMWCQVEGNHARSNLEGCRQKASEHIHVRCGP